MSEIGPLLVEAYTGNPTTLRLIQLAAGLSDTAAAEFCLVSPQTYRRWRTDRPPNRTAVRLLAIRAGMMPWPEWRGWQVHGGALYPPHLHRGGWQPGDLLAAPLWAQVASEWRREVERLRAAQAPGQRWRRRA